MKHLLKEAFKAGNESSVKPRKQERDVFARFSKFYIKQESKILAFEKKRKDEATLKENGYKSRLDKLQRSGVKLIDENRDLKTQNEKLSKGIKGLRDELKTELGFNRKVTSDLAAERLKNFDAMAKLTKTNRYKIFAIIIAASEMIYILSTFL